MTALEQLLIGAIGVGILGIAGFAARIMWVLLPRQLANNERQTLAVQQMSQTVAWLPYVLASNEAKFEAALSRGLSQLQIAAAAETERTRKLFEQMFDRMEDSIERRLSGQEKALHENTVEIARTTGNMAAVSVSASGKLTAVTSQTAETTLESTDHARAPTPTMAGVGARTASGMRAASTTRG